MPFVTRLTERLGIEHPILLAPMDRAADGRLAAAVSHAGGLGLIGGGYGDADWLRLAFPAAGNARVGCGFITWRLAENPELLDLALAHRPAALMLSFGDPAPFADRIKAAGAVLICQVQTVAQARQAVEAGADIIVAQGTEAGGHGASRSTFTLVPEIADGWPDIVLVAAGGVADGRGLAAALALGADGVLVGTRFCAAEESGMHPNARQRILQASGDDTVRSRIFDISRDLDWPAGYTGRVIRNDHSARWLGREDELARSMDEVRPAYARAREDGDFDMAGVHAGEAVGIIRDLPPAGEIVARMIAEAEATIARMATLAR
jgi:nitronate monooxygenase